MEVEKKLYLEIDESYTSNSDKSWKRTFFWGFFQQFEADILLSLEKSLPDDYELGFWVSKSAKADLNIFDILKMNVEVANNTPLPVGLYEKFVEKYFRDYVFMYDRYIDVFTPHDITNHNQYFVSDQINSIQYYLHLFYNILKKEKIQQIVMINPPHQGPDLILYFLAKELGLDTYMLYQTILPNRFFCFKDWADFGKYKKFENFGHSAPRYLVENKYEKSLFYMPKKEKGATQGKIPTDSKPKKIETKERELSFFKPFRAWFKSYKEAKVIRLIIATFSLLRLVKPYHFTRLNHWTNFFQRLDIEYSRIYKKSFLGFTQKEGKSALVPQFDKQAQTVKNYQHHHTKYLTSSIKHEVSLVDLQATDYIYFPLHYQPELTTSSLGGVYVDQLVCIENLALKLPKGWKIYVKENPKQGAYMRDNSFYERLSRIKNTTLVSKSVSTYELMHHAKLVGTVSGTAGWEAISGGKQTLIFGLAWYSHFPGVTVYNEEVDLESISKGSISHQELQEKVDEFCQFSTGGVIVKPYVKMIKNFRSEENQILLQPFFSSLLKKK